MRDEEILKQRLNIQDTVCVTLILVTAGAVAFLVRATSDDIFSVRLIPGGLAILFWAYSFFSGFQFFAQKSAYLAGNKEIRPKVPKTLYRQMYLFGIGVI